MDIKKLIALDIIVSTGSFNKAAEELGYTQAGISSMMNSIENELGLRLLDRNFNGIHLNENGKMLMPEIKKIIDAYNNFSDVIDGIKSDRQVSIKIASLDTITIKWLPKTLNLFHKDYPNIDVKIISGTPEEINSMLEQNTVDFALADRAWVSKEFSFIHLYDDQFFGVFPMSAEVENPFPIENFNGKKFFLPDFNSNKDIPKVFKKYGVQADYINDHISNQSILANVEAGLGVSIFTPLSLDSHYSKLIQKVPLIPTVSREICVALKSKENVNPTIKLFIKYLKKQIAEFTLE